jgi:hypothetical protein
MKTQLNCASLMHLPEILDKKSSDKKILQIPTANKILQVLGIKQVKKWAHFYL